MSWRHRLGLAQRTANAVIARAPPSGGCRSPITVVVAQAITNNAALDYWVHWAVSQPPVRGDRSKAPGWRTSQAEPIRRRGRDLLAKLNAMVKVAQELDVARGEEIVGAPGGNFAQPRA